MENFKTISYLTPEGWNDILSECGYDKRLRGGNFEQAKQLLKLVTEEHNFRNKTTKFNTLRNINMCRSIDKLWYAWFNIRNVMNNPSERINKKRRV